MTSEIYQEIFHLLQEDPAEEYKLSSDEHGSHLELYEYNRYDDTKCLHVC